MFAQLYGAPGTDTCFAFFIIFGLWRSTCFLLEQEPRRKAFCTGLILPKVCNKLKATCPRDPTGQHGFQAVCFKWSLLAQFYRAPQFVPYWNRSQEEIRFARVRSSPKFKLKALKAVCPRGNMGLRPYMTDKVGPSYATVALLILSGFCHGKCRRCIELCRTSSMLFDVGLKMALL